MASCRRLALVALLLLSLFSSAVAKPKVKVAPNGFPTGQSSPEGVASDLARAFITRDAERFRSLCVRPWGQGQARRGYSAYIDGVTQHLRGKEPPSSGDPTKITKVFAARHLTKNGPASYGYAGFDFQDVMFVDVEVALTSGISHLRRTMVIQDHDGKWYVQPVPDVDPLLSYGIYNEKASVQFFSDIYEPEH